MRTIDWQLKKEIFDLENEMRVLNGEEPEEWDPFGRAVINLKKKVSDKANEESKQLINLTTNLKDIAIEKSKPVIKKVVDKSKKAYKKVKSLRRSIKKKKT